MKIVYRVCLILVLILLIFAVYRSLLDKPPITLLTLINYAESSPRISTDWLDWELQNVPEWLHPIANSVQSFLFLCNSLANVMVFITYFVGKLLF